MKPVEVERILIESPKLSHGMFGLSTNAKDQSHILNILRNRLYTNKILAVLREYTSNGIDAHTSIGINRPIRVQLPTALDPHLLIRDYGPGLAEEDIYGIYTQYGASTKRDTDTQIGMLGIGAKSAFAYSDSFVVTSYCNGKKSVYVAALDETNTGVMSKQWEGPTEETGIEVRIPVKVTDLEQFKAEAYKLFRFYEPVPIVNYPIPPVEKPAFHTQSGYFMEPRKFISTHGARSWIGKVGVVPYNITMTSLLLSQELQMFTNDHCGCLCFSIGDVDIAANREELEYTPKTIKAIVSKLTELISESKKDVTCKVQATEGIERLKLIQRYYKEGLLSPYVFGRELVQQYIQQINGEKHIYQVKEYNYTGTQGETLYGKKKTLPITIFSKRLNKKWVESGTIDWSNHRKLLLLDVAIKPTQRNRYTKLSDYYVVQPDVGVSIDTAESLLRDRLKDLGLQGMEILRASQVDLDYVPPPPRVYVRKPTVVKTGLEYFDHRISSWVDLPRMMNPGDVYVLGQGEALIRDAVRVIAELDPFRELPTFVLVKKSYTGPLTGIPLRTWLPHAVVTSEGIDWHILQMSMRSSRIHCNNESWLEISKVLGEDHLVTNVLGSGNTANPITYSYLSDLVEIPKAHGDYVQEMYPLLFDLRTFSNLANAKPKALAHYIQLIDKYGA